MSWKSRPFNEWIIVTKRPRYNYFGGEDKASDKLQYIFDELFNESEDKTFWLIHESGDFVRRYSIESAPQWVEAIYDTLRGRHA